MARAKHVYRVMQQKGISLETKNYDKLIKVCLKAGAIADVQFFMQEMKNRKLEPNIETLHNILELCLKTKQYSTALELFEELGPYPGWIDTRIQVVYNLLLRQCLQDGNLLYAQKYYALSAGGLFKSDIITTNHLIDFHANAGDTAKAMAYYRDRKANPDRVTFNSLMKAGVIARKNDFIHEVFLEMQRQGMNPDINMHKHCWKIVKNEWSKALDDDKKQNCRTFYATCQRVDDIGRIAITNPHKHKQIQEECMKGSRTLTRNADARKRWEATDQWVREAAKRKEPLTLDFFCRINRSLGGAGTFPTANQEVYAGGYPEYIYAPGEFIHEEMAQFVSKLGTIFDRCDKGLANPIEKAAKASQILVSIHPFSNENGRTSRMLMDYILQHYHLPPAAIGSNVLNGIFTFAINGVNTSSATQNILQGVRESYRLIKP